MTSPCNASEPPTPTSVSPAQVAPPSGVPPTNPTEDVTTEDPIIVTNPVFQESEEINLGSRTTDYLKRSNSFEKDMTDSLTSQSSGSDELESNCQTLPIGESSSSVGTAHSCKNGKDPSEEERSKAEGSRLKEVLTINDLRQSSTSDKESSKPQMIMDNVGDLVAGLGHAKEQIRSSIGKRGITFSHSVKLCSNT